MRRNKGFTLIELLIVLALLSLMLALTLEMTIGTLRTYKQYSKSVESNIAGVIGLEIMRRDIEGAGYGLPWVIPAGTTYQEATNPIAMLFNDSPSAAPRAILTGDGNAIGTAPANGIVAGSDYLVVKAINLEQNATCQKWHYLYSTGIVSNSVTTTENLVNADRVIILDPGSTATPTGETETSNMVLVAPSGANLGASTLFQNAAGFVNTDDNRIIYGADPNTNLRMPFNRADYYVSIAGVPGRCAPGTGVLVKAIVSQSDGGFSNTNILPLLDCVADMQVYTLRASLGNTSAAINAADAQTLRSDLQEVIVSILAQVGQQDPSYSNNTNPILVGFSPLNGLGRNFDFAAAGIPNWQKYRWKIYTLVARPNLR